MIAQTNTTSKAIQSTMPNDIRIILSHSTPYPHIIGISSLSFSLRLDRPASHAREKPWRVRSIVRVRLAKLRLDLAFFAPCHPHIHGHQDREHHQREQGGPLE